MLLGRTVDTLDMELPEVQEKQIQYLIFFILTLAGWQCQEWKTHKADCSISISSNQMSKAEIPIPSKMI